MKTLKVTITNLQQINDGIVCGVKVRFKVIHFEHVQGGRPLLKLTIAHDIAPAPVSSPVLDQEPLEGELVQEQQTMVPGGRRSRHRRGGKQ